MCLGFLYNKTTNTSVHYIKPYLLVQVTIARTLAQFEEQYFFNTNDAVYNYS